MMKIKSAFVLVLGLALMTGCNRDNGNNNGGGGGVATTPNTWCLNQAPGTPGCQGFQNAGWNGIQPYPYGNGMFGPNFSGCNQFAGGFNGVPAGGAWAPIYGANMGLGCINMMALPYPYNMQSMWGNINWWNYPQATGFGGWGAGIYGGIGFGVGVGGQWGGMARYCQINAPGTCGFGQCIPVHPGSFMGICVGGGMW